MLKKFVIWAGIAFVMFFVAFRPAAAGDLVAAIGQATVDIFTGVGEFFGGLAA